MKQSIREKLEQVQDRYEELGNLLSDSEVISDQEKFRAYSKEYAEIEPVVQCFDRYLTVLDDIEAAKEIAAEIGFPILIKASAGGGGKGMRVVENAEEFESQMERAVSEAESSFGDGRCFIEKYVSAPRHIEIQVLGDRAGS